MITVWICYKIGLRQDIGAMIGGEVAIISNFSFNNLWTFGDTKEIKEQGSILKRFTKFNLTSVGAIGIQGIVSFIALQIFGEHINLFGNDVPTSIVVLIPTILFIVIPMNYFVYNKLIWKTHLKKKKSDNGTPQK